MERRPQWTKTVSYVSPDSPFEHYVNLGGPERLKAS